MKPSEHTSASAGIRRTDWTDPLCPVARAIDLIGDKWSLLIVRDAFDGARSFTEFHRSLGVARNILTDRLRRLTECGVLTQQVASSGKRREYVLTESGHDLFITIVALRQWGERHAFTEGEEHSKLVTTDGSPVPTLALSTTSGQTLSPNDTHVDKVEEPPHA